MLHALSKVYSGVLVCFLLTSLALIFSVRETSSDSLQDSAKSTTKAAHVGTDSIPHQSSFSEGAGARNIQKTYKAPNLERLRSTYPSLEDVENEALWVESVQHDSRCPLGRAFILPTYGPHFRYLIEGLGSAQHYVHDAHNFHYIIIVSDQAEKVTMQSLLKLNDIKLPTEVVTLPEVLQDFYPDKTFVEDILPVMMERGVHAWFGKIKYQSWKKVYGTLFSRCQRSYWLDSEFLVVKPMSFDLMFNQFFARRRFFYSISKDFNGWPTHAALEILGLKDDIFLEDTWFHETFDWFIERDVLLDLMKYSETHSFVIRPVEPYRVFGAETSIAKPPNSQDPLTFFEIGLYSSGPIFEYTLYQIYIWANRQSYPQFEWAFTRQVMSNVLAAAPESLWDFDRGRTEITPAPFRRWQAAQTPQMGNFEFVLAGLNREHFQMYKDLVEYYHIWAFRTPPPHSREYLCQIVLESDALGLHVVDDHGFPPPDTPNCSELGKFKHKFIELSSN